MGGDRLVNRAVFLDRDGVINRVVLRDGRSHPPSSVSDMHLLPGVVEAVAMLRDAGFRIIVVTNQPDVAAGVKRRAEVEAIHEEILRRLTIDEIKVCYHVDRDGCACRKPKPGMLLEAASKWSLSLDRSFMVGDRWRDIAAGKAAGCKTILIRAGYNERPADDPDAVVNSLYEAGLLILSSRI